MELTIHGLAELLKKNLGRLDALDASDREGALRLASALQRVGQSSVTLGESIFEPILDASACLSNVSEGSLADIIAQARQHLLTAQQSVTMFLAWETPSSGAATVAGDAPTSSIASPSFSAGMTGGAPGRGTGDASGATATSAAAALPAFAFPSASPAAAGASSAGAAAASARSTFAGGATGPKSFEMPPPVPMSQGIVSPRLTTPAPIDTRPTDPRGIHASQNSGLPRFDADVLAVYVTEAMDHLDSAESAILEAEQDGDVKSRIHKIFRAFHTIKGGAALCGLQEVGAIAHLTETLLMQVRDGQRPLSADLSEASLRSADMLRHLMQAALEQRRDVPEGYPVLMEVLTLLSSLPILPLQKQREDVGLGAGVVPPTRPRESSPGRDGLMAALESAGIGGAAAAGAAHAQGVRGEGYTRVRTDRLDALVDAVGEFVIAVGMLAQDESVSRNIQSDLFRKVDQCARLMRTVQDLSLGMRMVPLKNTFQRMSRLARDTAISLGKPVRFFTDGDETEIDRNMVDLFADPLLHMVRNAIDHGIEPVEDRLKAGKSREGNLLLSARHVGGMVEIRLEDDGRGLDAERITRTAIQRGLITSANGLSDDDIYRLIFEPGFSTAEKITEVSGRGVGMDMVKHGIEMLKGRIDIITEQGVGTAFVVQLPLTMAISESMLLRVGAERYVLPVLSIIHSLRPAPDQLVTVGGRGEMVRVRGSMVPIVRLHRLFNIPGAVESPCAGLLVIIQSGERMAALLVDELQGQQQVVVKSLGEALGPVPGLAGGAILGDGQVGLILDPAGLMLMARQQSSPGARRAA